MTIEELKQAVLMEANDFYFVYKGLRAGVEFTIEDGIFSFDVWYGNNEKHYGEVTFDEIIHDKFYDGRSISELLSEGAIDIEFT